MPEVAKDSSAMAAHDKWEKLVETMSNSSFQDILSMVLTGAMELVIKILLGLAIYFIGRWIIKRIVKVLRKMMEMKQVDVSLSHFVINVVKVTSMIMLLLVAIGIMGINTTSFLAIFASAGLAVGMALSGTLQNFAGGVLILFLKPYRVGDFIEAQGYMGTVKEISLFNTLLNTPDNKMIIIPNGGLSTGIINNFSKEKTRRVEWIFGVAYGTDFDYVKSVILEVINADERVQHEIEPYVALHAMADSSVNVVLRAWTNAENYWFLYFDINERIYKKFNEVGVNIPFPQMDIHFKNPMPKE